MASSADWYSPSVPFLKPTGMERPLVISRWVCDSVVRAPMAAQETRSAMYCGTIGSRNSVAAGRAEAVDLEQKRARHPQALGNVVRPVEVRVGDEALPADGGARLLEVDAHDDEQHVADLVRELRQALGVLEALLRAVDGARPNDGEEAAVGALKDVRDVAAALGHGCGDGVGHGQRFLEVLGGVERLNGADTEVFQLHNVKK